MLGMARQTIRHGATIDAATPREIAAMVAAAMGTRRQRSRVRQTVALQLDAAGAGRADVYTIPAGMEFEARRVVLDLNSAGDPSTGNVPLNVAGKFVRYLRSGQAIEYAVPISPNAAPQVPGVQSWGEEQGPYVRNLETFQVQAVGLTANGILEVLLEGVLFRRE